MELSYKVVNRDWNQSLPETFPVFIEAMRSRNEWDSDAIIECHSSDGVEVVYDPNWENISIGNDFFLNSSTPLKVVSEK